MADVFISYRIADASAHAGRLADALKVYWGRRSVFLGADDIAQGTQWRDELMRQLNACRVVLAVIGPGWSTIQESDGVRRITKADDIVRMEIREALALGRPVIPVLVGGAVLPAPSELPDDIAPFLNRNRSELRDDHWKSDIGDLVEGLRKVAPSLRLQDLGRLFASRRGWMAVLAALSVAMVAAQLLLVRLDLMDAYRLKLLPVQVALLFAILLLSHNVAVRRTR